MAITRTTIFFLGQPTKNMRLGVTEFEDMYFDLNQVLHSLEDLGQLEYNFSRDEIDKIIQELPSDKSLGTGGFNDEFIKKCWHLIVHEFYALREAFLSRGCLSE